MATTSQILSGVKPGDTVVVDGADRLRDGADVEIPNQTAKIAAPSGAGADDARACRTRAQIQAQVTKPAARMSKKSVPHGPDRGARQRMCLFQNRDRLSDDCSKVFRRCAVALAAAARKARRGRRSAP